MDTDLLSLLHIPDPSIHQERAEPQLPSHLRPPSMMQHKLPKKRRGRSLFSLKASRHDALPRPYLCHLESEVFLEVHGRGWDTAKGRAVLASMSVMRQVLSSGSAWQRSPELSRRHSGWGHCPQKTAVASAQTQTPSVPFSSSAFPPRPLAVLLLTE